MGGRYSTCLDSSQGSRRCKPEDAERIVKRYGIPQKGGPPDLRIYEETMNLAKRIEDSTPVSARKTSSFILPGGGTKKRKLKKRKTKKKNSKNKNSKKKKIKTKKNKTKTKRKRR
tara:strand:+ start:75 stop:419 length:345 start_codon:yes stop_codon:yes gene_type:complete